jgi:hypothetical protein
VYDLPALPPAFCWSLAEIAAPAMVCERLNAAQAELSALVLSEIEQHEVYCGYCHTFGHDAEDCPDAPLEED